MKTLLILGAGAGGSMVANKMSRILDLSEWRIIVVDKDENHYYQPGFLFVPFEVEKLSRFVKPKQKYLPNNVEFILSDIEIIEPDKNKVKLTANKQVIDYDYLVIATGTDIKPAEIEGMTGEDWHRNIHDFYTPEGSLALRDYLQSWDGGKLVINIAEMPIKCPVAPLEFAFMADWYFQKRNMRNKVEISYVTPLSGAFTKERAANLLGDMLEEKNVHIVPDFNIGEVDIDKKVIRSFDEREVEYDLLVSIPTNMGAEVYERSGMGDELNHIPVDKNTLQSKKWENVFVIGDASDVPTSKAGSVVHFMHDTLTENIIRQINGKELKPGFDGHANCFIETGFHKGILIDFNYDVDPLPGVYPYPLVGPFSLLKESYINHLGKIGFDVIYWNFLVRAIPMPITHNLSMAGKKVENLESHIKKEYI